MSHVCSTLFSRIMPNFGLQRSRIKQVPLQYHMSGNFCGLIIFVDFAARKDPEIIHPHTSVKKVVADGISTAFAH